MVLLSAASLYAGNVACSNSAGDSAAVQAAVNAGGTVVISGKCSFSKLVNLNVPVTIQGGGTSPSINGNGSKSGFAFSVNVDHVTITGLTFNNAIGAAELTGLSRGYFTFTYNTVSNTNGINAIQVDNIIRYSLIDSNYFYNIAPNGFQSATYASLGFGACYSLPSHCDIPGEAIAITGGMDNTSVTNNKADYIANNFMHADWHIIGASAYYYLTTNNNISYNTMTHVHRMGIELQGTSSWPNCGVNYTTSCNFSVSWTSNMKVAGNYYHAPFLPYQSWGYSLVFQGSGVEINNAAISEAGAAGQDGQAFEDLGYGILTQGNVFSGDPLTVNGKTVLAWEGGIIYGYNGAIPGSLYTTQNNVVCSIQTANFGTENNSGGAYLAKALNQYNYLNSTCPGAGHLTNSAISLAFTSSSTSGSSQTFNLSATNTLPIKWVQFFVDGSPVGTQEIQDVNTNFAADHTWLYHATLNTGAMSHGNHQITATATDVSGSTSTVAKSFVL